MKKETLTPMMKQYFEIKNEYKDCILFYRMGDFYEMFYDDAKTASQILDIALTKRNSASAIDIPMCGVPFHAAEPYLNKIVKAGYKVAICEQTENPKEAKGIVRREVIRIVTPGTNLDTTGIDERKNNFLVGICKYRFNYGLSAVDVSTGEFLATELSDERLLIEEINRFEPSEIVYSDNFSLEEILTKDLIAKLNILCTKLEHKFYASDKAQSIIEAHFRVGDVEAVGLAKLQASTNSIGMLLNYLYNTQKNELSHITTVKLYYNTSFMILDASTRRNLELTETMRDKQKKGSLLGILDETKTAMGGRLLRKLIEKPLIDREAIEGRLDFVEELTKNVITMEEIREYLSSINDIERLVTKICYKSATPRDLLALMTSLELLPYIRDLLGGLTSRIANESFERFDILSDIYEKIKDSIVEEPPLTLRDGNIIKSGYDEEIDRLRTIGTRGKELVSELEEQERKNTGIKNLKIKYNRVFGYYIEVTNSYKNLVPEGWTRRQTLANSERYVTKELSEFESMILGATDRLAELEYEIFSRIRDEIAEEIVRIKSMAIIIANIDVFSTLAKVAGSEGYVRPKINNLGIIDIKDGSHPVIKKIMAENEFIVNDTYLDTRADRIAIITGPNMAGKSTYMRQTALIVLMAQMGSFVPAVEANIGICDRIFTRVGAADDLASGHSTFMVEMIEVANILRNATKNSLLILDEIGRGTSTFDGLAIAFAVVEYINDSDLLGAKTLFATHYHELTELEGRLKNVKNYCIMVKENGEEIIFLRKITRGGADKSYGIEVARLAGVPKPVIDRAIRISKDLSKNRDIKIVEKNVKKGCDEKQLTFFQKPVNADVIREITELKLEETSPIAALGLLYEMQKKLKE